MMAAKSFRPPVKNLQQIQHWATILGTELYTRVIDDFELNQRWPKNLVVCVMNLHSWFQSVETKWVERLLHALTL